MTEIWWDPGPAADGPARAHPRRAAAGGAAPQLENPTSLVGGWEMGRCGQDCRGDRACAASDVHPGFVARGAQPWHQHRQRAGFIAATCPGAADDDRYPLGLHRLSTRLVVTNRRTDRAHLSCGLDRPMRWLWLQYRGAGDIVRQDRGCRCCPVGACRVRVSHGRQR